MSETILCTRCLRASQSALSRRLSSCEEDARLSTAFQFTIMRWQMLLSYPLHAVIIRMIAHWVLIGRVDSICMFHLFIPKSAASKHNSPQGSPSLCPWVYLLVMKVTTAMRSNHFLFLIKSYSWTTIGWDGCLDSKADRCAPRDALTNCWHLRTNSTMYHVFRDYG